MAFSYAPLLTVPVVAITPMRPFFVALAAAAAPGETTPKTGMSNFSFMASKLFALAVFHAIITALTFLLSKNRTS